MMVYGLRVNRSLSEDLDLRLNHDPLFSAQTNETNTTNLQPEIEIKFFLILMTATMATGYRHVSLQTPKDPNSKSLQPEHFFHVGVHHWNLSRSHSNSNLLDVFLAKNLPLYPETVCTSKLLTFCVGKT